MLVKGVLVKGVLLYYKGIILLLIYISKIRGLGSEDWWRSRNALVPLTSEVSGSLPSLSASRVEIVRSLA